MHTHDEDVLLLKRARPFEFWQSVTGSLEQGEEPADAATRELFEETGLSDEGVLLDSGRQRRFTIDPRWRGRYAPGVTENTEYEWHFQLPAPLDIRTDVAEHSDSRWVPVQTAIDHVWSWTNREALSTLALELRSKQ